MADKVVLKDVQELSLNFENRTFVDYFNTFLCLPVFGQHVIYNYTETEFEFEPPIKHRRHLYLDRREILIWLCKERVRLFQRSALYTEYCLCMKLRSTKVDIPGLKHTDPNGEDRRTFVRNMFGTVAGMMLFRESLRGTNGEHVYRCWKDIEAWKLIEEQERKIYWKRAIKTKYINQNSTSKVKGSVKVPVFQGSLNFGLVDEDAAGNDETDIIYGNMEVHCVTTDEALLQMQVILLRAVKKYWLPRYLIHILKTTPENILDILKRPAPGDMDYMDLERKLRCRFMFPTIYQESNISSPATTVYVSKSAGDLPCETPNLLEEPDDEFDDSYDDDNETVEPVDPVDLLSIWGGPARQIKLGIKDNRSSSSLSSFPESPDNWGKHQLRSRAYSVASRPPRSPIPIELTSFLGGKKRTLLGRFPNTSNRIVWSLASDILASCPFRAYLQTNEHFLDVDYLSFWTDVRNYLDVDENAVNGIGQPLRRLLAHGIIQKYLSQDQGGIELFSETLKMALCEALMDNGDVSLLCMAQDIVQESLWEPLKLYIEAERKQFLAQVRGKRYDLSHRQQRELDRMARKSKSNMTAAEYEDPLCFFQCETLETDGESLSTTSPPVFSPTIPRGSAMSRPATSYHVCISEAQMWKATELAVLCCEYGSPMMVPQYPPKISQLVDVLHSDYGSLHVSRQPTVRNEWLRNLVDPPKIDIESIRVSRKVFLEEIDMTAIRDREAAKMKNRMVVRRNGLVLERPTKPKSFIDVLTTAVHFDFFKRFMMVQKKVLPLMFWKAVEDLKELNNLKTRHIRVTQIMKKFFGKYAKNGALLDCHEEIIRQIPKMDKVTTGILICAQAAIYRSMERKWYPMYLDTYPPESETLAPTAISIAFTPQNKTPELLDIVDRAKKPRRKYEEYNRHVVRMWSNLSHSLVEFHRSISSKYDIQLLQIFLKCEIEKEQVASLNKDHINSNIHPLEKNMLLSNLDNVTQTRVVIRNRLVILNRLPADLRFWLEVRKFQDLVDSTTLRGTVSSQDSGFLYDKAKSIISCYLASDVPPKVQVNIPNDMALNIINTLAAHGISRGLFHDAIILLFPVLYYYYKKFQDEVLNGDISDKYLETFENTMKNRLCTNPNADRALPDLDDVKILHHDMDETLMKIRFSLSDGIIHIYPTPKVQKVGSIFGGRRMTKHSIHALPEEFAQRRGSVFKQPPDDKKDGRQTRKGGDSRGHVSVKPMLAKHSPPKQLFKDPLLMNPVIKTPLPPKHAEKPKKPEKVKVIQKKNAKTLNVKTGDNHMSERARRLNTLVKSMNNEKQRKQKVVNKKYNTGISFDEVVKAALNKLSASNTLFS